MRDLLRSLKSIRYPLSALLALVTCCGFGSYLLRAWTLTVSAENVTARKANKLFWHVGSPLQVPENAKNVTLRASLHQTYVTFEIGEKDFEQWASKWHWKLEPISGGQCKSMGILSQCFYESFPESIADGCSYSNSSHRGGWDVAYDRSVRRVWVSYARH